MTLSWVMLSANTWVHLCIFNIATTDTFFIALLGKTLKKVQDLWTLVVVTHSWRQKWDGKKKKDRQTCTEKLESGGLCTLM